MYRLIEFEMWLTSMALLKHDTCTRKNKGLLLHMIHIKSLDRGQQYNEKYYIVSAVFYETNFCIYIDS